MAKRKRAVAPAYKGVCIGRLNAWNGRYVGSRVAVHFDGTETDTSEWIEGRVTAVYEATLLVEFGTTEEGWRLRIDPDMVYGVLLYRPIRVGSDYQAVIS